MIARTKTDMLFKYFLDYLPEEVNLIDPSLLTVFIIDKNMHDKMPKKRKGTCLLEDQIEYTKELLNLVYENYYFYEELTSMNGI